MRKSLIHQFNPADSFGTVSDSSGKVILVNASLFTYFSDIIGNRHKDPFFQLHHPELAGKPLAVGGDPEARHGIVLTAD